MHIPSLLALLLIALPVLAQEEFPGVEKLMTAEEFRAAGLDKLDEQERAALNQWLIHYTALEAPLIRGSSKAVQEAEQQEIRARIEPPFSGWDGNTVFNLDNGQVWQQRLSGRLRYEGEDTEVVIRKNFFGYYRLEHLASGKSVGVKRLK
jgi:hypothetical protein